MIIKSSQRAGHQELAAHLMKSRDIDGTPQTVTVSGSRGLIGANDVHQALGDMAIIAMASSRCQKDLYHISLSPDQGMTEQDWETVWQLYEDEFGLGHLPYIEVTHAKGDHRPPHQHRVYERVDIEGCKALQLSHTRIRNELVARKIEFVLGYHLTIGKHNRTVIKRLEEDGEQDMIAWMQQGHAHDCDRPVAKQNHADVQMEKHTKLSTERVKADLQAAYEHTDNGQSFRAAIVEKGYHLARGDRRDFVIVDAKGGIHSPRRRLSIKAKELRQRWADLEQVSLAHVDAVVRQVKAQWADSDNDNSATSAAASQSSADGTSRVGDNLGLTDGTSLSDLQQEAIEIAAEIEELEATITADDANQLNDEVWNYWQRQGGKDIEPERRKPRSRVSNRSGRGGKSKSSNTRNEDSLLKLQGQDAIAERHRRLGILSQPKPDYAGSNQVGLDAIGNLSGVQALQQGVTDYQRFWQERFKGQTATQLLSNQAYRLGTDRWILQRLARRGYSRIQARYILIRSSPELMNQRPHERLSYLRRIVNQVYTPYEQQQRLTKLKENTKQQAPDSKLKNKSRSVPSKPSTKKTLAVEQHPSNKSEKSMERSTDNGLER